MLYWYQEEKSNTNTQSWVQIIKEMTGADIILGIFDVPQDDRELSSSVVQLVSSLVARGRYLPRNNRASLVPIILKTKPQLDHVHCTLTIQFIICFQITCLDAF